MVERIALRNGGSAIQNLAAFPAPHLERKKHHVRVQVVPEVGIVALGVDGEAFAHGVLAGCCLRRKERGAHRFGEIPPRHVILNDRSRAVVDSLEDSLMPVVESRLDRTDQDLG